MAVLCCAVLWEQSLLAKQAPRFLKDRIASIAGKPCSHTANRGFITLPGDTTPSPRDTAPPHENPHRR
ncbi:hypothetical protein C1C98_09710 [Pseudomonas ogarae]|uniref:Uncharacterized protein n=1 Tax=Pseudomonas ogarae (strain DSM 112162 / CECT 30235 / F113) TaxID=1114970 RepID=A0ABM6QYV5_PSEO1|nr:hypothetical protein C1C98_09710 [Pseudomonas ogarae]